MAVQGMGEEMIKEIRIPTDTVLEQKMNQMITEINRLSDCVALLLGRTEGRLSDCVALLLGRTEGFDIRFEALEKKMKGVQNSMCKIRALRRQL